MGNTNISLETSQPLKKVVMEKQEIVQLLKEQLPALLEERPELERWIERLTAQRYANRQQTESRFDQLMEELRHDREEQSRKWEESKAES